MTNDSLGIKVGDWVCFDKERVGEVIFIDEKTMSAEVEYKEYNYTNSIEVPLSSLEKLY